MKYLILLWLIYFSSADCSITHAINIAKQIIKSENPQQHQKKLALYLKTTTPNQLYRQNDLQCIFQALSLLTTPLTPFISALQQSLSRFEETPGYNENLRLIVIKPYDEGLVNGHAYEIERALALADIGEPILGFNVTLRTRHLRREFDVLTQNYAIECKNIRWKNEVNKKLTQQFLAQKKIIDHKNRQSNYNRRFQVSSKQSVPECWHHWFAENDIDVYEEPKPINQY